MLVENTFNLTSKSQNKKNIFYKWTSIKEKESEYKKIDSNAIGELDCWILFIERRDIYHPPFPFTIGRIYTFFSFELIFFSFYIIHTRLLKKNTEI